MGGRVGVAIGLAVLMGLSGVTGWLRGRAGAPAADRSAAAAPGPAVTVADAPPSSAAWRAPRVRGKLPLTTPDYEGFLAPSVPPVTCSWGHHDTLATLEGSGPTGERPRALSWPDLGIDVAALLHGEEAALLKAAAAYLDLPVAQQPRSLRAAGIPARTLLTTARGMVIINLIDCRSVFYLERQGRGWRAARLYRARSEHGRVRLADVSGDGRPELIFEWKYGSGGFQSVEVWQERGGRLQSVFSASGLDNGTFTLTDTDGDGRPELILTTQRYTWQDQMRDYSAPERYLLQWSGSRFRLIRHEQVQPPPDGLKSLAATEPPPWWRAGSSPPPAQAPPVTLVGPPPLPPAWQPPAEPITAPLPMATPEMPPEWRPPDPDLGPSPKAVALGLPGAWGLDARRMFAPGYPPEGTNLEVLRGVALWLSLSPEQRPPAPNWAGIPGTLLVLVPGPKALVQVDRTGGIYWLEQAEAGWLATALFTQLPAHRDVRVDDLNGDGQPEAVVAAVVEPHRHLQVDVLSVTPTGVRPRWRTMPLPGGAWRLGERRADGTRDLILDQAGPADVLRSALWELPPTRERFVLRWQQGRPVLLRHLRSATPH